MAGSGLDDAENGRQLPARRRDALRPGGRGTRPGNGEHLPGDFIRRQDLVDHAGGDGVSRHVGIGGALLRPGPAPCRLPPSPP